MAATSTKYSIIKVVSTSSPRLSESEQIRRIDAIADLKLFLDASSRITATQAQVAFAQATSTLAG